MTDPIEVTGEDRRNQYRRLYRAFLAMDYAEGAQDHDEAEAEAFSIFCDSLDAAEARGAERERARVVELEAALAKIMPIRVHNGQDYAEVYFADGQTHSTQAMTMNPQDWLDIAAALSRHADQGEGL